MQLEWVLLAEGMGTTASGAVTLISINQNVLAAMLPTTTKRAVVAHFVGDPSETAEDLAGQDVTVSAQVKSPSGKTVFANTASGKFASPPWPDLPAGLDVALEVQMRISEYGRYEIVVTTQADEGKAMEARTYLYVKEPPSIPS